jgi:hypothetical protein
LKETVPLVEKAPAEKQQEVYLKLLGALVRARQVDEGVKLVTANSPLAKPGPDAIGQVLVACIESLLAQNLPDVAIDSLNKLDAPARQSLGTSWVEKLQDLRAKAQKLQQAKNPDAAAKT